MSQIIPFDREKRLSTRRAQDTEHHICTCPACVRKAFSGYEISEGYRSPVVRKYPALQALFPSLFMVKRKKLPTDQEFRSDGKRKGIARIGYFLARIDQLPFIESEDIRFNRQEETPR